MGPARTLWKRHWRHRPLNPTRLWDGRHPDGSWLLCTGLIALWTAGTLRLVILGFQLSLSEMATAVWEGLVLASALAALHPLVRRVAHRSHAIALEEAPDDYNPYQVLDQEALRYLHHHTLQPFALGRLWSHWEQWGRPMREQERLIIDDLERVWRHQSARMPYSELARVQTYLQDSPFGVAGRVKHLVKILDTAMDADLPEAPKRRRL